MSDFYVSGKGHGLTSTQCEDIAQKRPHRWHRVRVRLARPAPDLFPSTTKPQRAKPRALMHVSDATDCHTGAQADMGKPMCRMKCAKCGTETNWLVFDTVTQAKRGIPCEMCNAPRPR